MDNGRVEHRLVVLSLGLEVAQNLCALVPPINGFLNERQDFAEVGVQLSPEVIQRRVLRFWKAHLDRSLTYLEHALLQLL